jgi:hypothetical protein
MQSSYGIGGYVNPERLLPADDIMPLVASLPDSERIGLLRWIFDD